MFSDTINLFTNKKHYGKEKIYKTYYKTFILYTF